MFWCTLSLQFAFQIVVIKLTIICRNNRKYFLGVYSRFPTRQLFIYSFMHMLTQKSTSDLYFAMNLNFYRKFHLINANFFCESVLNGNRHLNNFYFQTYRLHFRYLISKFRSVFFTEIKLNVMSNIFSVFLAFYLQSSSSNVKRQSI